MAITMSNPIMLSNFQRFWLQNTKYQFLQGVATLSFDFVSRQFGTKRLYQCKAAILQASDTRKDGLYVKTIPCIRLCRIDPNIPGKCLYLDSLELVSCKRKTSLFSTFNKYDVIILVRISHGYRSPISYISAFKYIHWCITWCATLGVWTIQNLGFKRVLPKVNHPW